MMDGISGTVFGGFLWDLLKLCQYRPLYTTSPISDHPPDNPPADASEQASGTETIERPRRNIKPPIRFKDFVVTK